MQKREFKYEFPFFKYYFDTAPFYLYNAKRVLIKKSLLFRSDFGGLPGNRTPDTLIKSQVLYRLS